MRLIDADALATKLRYMGYMDENEEVQEVIDRFAEECDGDSISKLSVLELIDDYNSDALGSVFIDYSHGLKFKRAVSKLPPAEPEQKTGEWIDDEFLGQYRCSECDYYSIDEYSYCPMCGAKMEAQDD